MKISLLSFFRIAHNHAVNQLRRMVKETMILQRKQNQNNQISFCTLNGELYYKDIRLFINNIVEHLPPQQKIIYRLSREEYLKQKEIAQKLDLSLSTVKNHLLRTLIPSGRKCGNYGANERGGNLHITRIKTM